MSRYPLADVHAEMAASGHDVSVLTRPWVSELRNLHPTQCRPDLQRVDIDDPSLKGHIRSICSCTQCDRTPEGRYWVGLQDRLSDAVATSSRVTTACGLLEDGRSGAAEAFAAYRDLLQYLHPEGGLLHPAAQIERAQTGIQDWAALPDSAHQQDRGLRSGDEFICDLLTSALERWVALEAARPAHRLAQRDLDTILADAAAAQAPGPAAEPGARTADGRRVLYLREPGSYISLAGFTGQDHLHVDAAVAIASERTVLGRWETMSGGVHYLIDYDDPTLPDVTWNNGDPFVGMTVAVVGAPHDDDQCRLFAELALAAGQGDDGGTFPALFQAVRAAHS